MVKPRVNFDDYTENYNELLRKNTKFFSSSEAYFARYKVDIFRREFKGTAKRLLEFGCGIGRNIPYLREAFPGATIVGSDISPGSLEIARQEISGVEFILDEPSAELDDDYDAIFIAGVFHHIPVDQRAGTMSKLRQRLAPDGMIMIFEHNPYNPVTRRIVNECPYDADAVLLKPSELKSLMATAGFSSLSSGYCLFLPPKIAANLPIEQHLAWLPLGGQYWASATGVA